MTEEMKEHIEKYHSGEFNLKQCKICEEWDSNIDLKTFICIRCGYDIAEKERDRLEKDEKYQKALSKLTYEDKKALGIISRLY